MSKHHLPPNHRTVLDNAAVLQLQTFLQRRDLEAIWDAFDLLDCIHFHATSLGPSAIHSIHTALWTLIQSLYAEKRYTIVLSYCQLALHPSLTPSHNTPVFQRRLLAVFIDLGDYTDAFALFESLPASTRDDLSTRVLVFRLAARAWNQPLAQECLQFFARTDSSSSSSSKEAARDALYACVREAQTAGARLCTVQALTAAAASWKGEVVVAAHVASLLRCAIRLLQAMAAAEEEGSESNAGFASSEVVALFHTAAEFVASNARDDHGDLVFPAAELRWFSTNAYNLGVVHCTLWEPGRLVSLFQSCLVFTQALSSCTASTSTSTSDDDAPDAADLVLTVLRCHFVLASLYMSEAQLPDNEHTPSLYADVERHASAYAALFTETCGAAATSSTPCPDLRQKLGVLCVFHCEALLSRQSYDHAARIIKQAGRLCSNDVNVLKALGGCLIQSEAPVTVKSSMLKSIVNEIFALENFTSDRLAQYLRCMVQVLLPMTDDSAARDILEQAVQVAHEAKQPVSLVSDFAGNKVYALNQLFNQVGVAFPVEEAAWLAAAAFNHGLTRYAARHDMAACRGWMDKAVAMAQHADENGQFAASMQARRQTLVDSLVDSSVAGTL